MTYVDERIVDMQFENKQFETAAAETMGTLDKLKEKLSFKNASSGVDQLQKAVNNINVNPVLQGLENIEYRMSTLGIAGKRVVENIVDIAMSGIHKIYNKLQAPLNQIVTGGKSRAQNIEQAKFQLEGLGVAWDDIQEDINYGVQDTAYGLDAAAKVASQLVASQVELGDEMKHALLGISGVAAMTNSSYEDIGRIYTTVAGNGRLMGEQLLQLSSRGINAAAQLAKAMNTTEADIRDMVSKGKISFQMFSDAMFESFGEHAKEANKTFSGALSNTKAALSRLGADIAAQGFNSIRDILNEIIPKLKEFKKRIKPIEDGIIRLIDVVGKLVEQIVKAIDIEKIVDRIVPKMTSFIETAVDWVTAYKQVFTGQDAAVKGGTAFYYEQQALNGLTGSVKDATDAQMKLTDVTEDQIRIANEIWYQGLHGTGDARREELGKDYEAVQYYIEQMMELGWDEAKMQEKIAKTAEEEQVAIENLAKTEKKREFITKITSALQNLKTVVKNVSESIRNVLSVAFRSFGKAFNASDGVGGIVGFTGALARLSEKFKITEEKAEKLAPIFDKLYKAIKTAWSIVKIIASGVVFVVKTVSEALRTFFASDIFNSFKSKLTKGADTIKTTVKDISKSIETSGIIKTFTNIAKSLVTNGSSFVGEFVKNVSGAIYTVLSNAGSIIGALVEFASSVLANVIDVLSVPISAILGLLGDMLSAISQFDVGQLVAMAVFFEVLFSILKLVWKAVGLVEAVINIPISISKFLYNCAKIPKAIKEVIDGYSKVLRANARKMNVESFRTLVDIVKDIVWSIIALTVVMSSIPNADKFAWQAFAIVGTMTVLIGVMNIISDALIRSSIKKAGGIRINVNLQKAQMALLFGSIASLIAVVVNGIATLYKIISSIDYDQTAFVASISIIVGITALLSALVLTISYALTKIKAKDTYNWRKTNLVEVSVLLVAFAGSLKLIVSAINDLYQTVKESSNMNRFTAIMGFIAALYGIVIALVYMLSKFKKVKGMIGLSVMFLAFAASFKIIVSSLKTIVDVSNEMESYDKFLDVMGQLVLILGILGAVAIALVGIISKAKGFKTGPLIGIAAVFLTLSVVLKSIGTVFATMTKAQKESGSASFKDALNALCDTLFMVGLVLSVITAINKDVKGIGSMLGLAAVFVSLSLILTSIASSVSKLSDIPIDELSGILISVGLFITLISGIMVAIANFAKAGSTLSLVGITASILGLAIAISILGTTFRNINKDMGADTFRSLALTMGVFVGAIVALVTAMTYLTGPVGMASLLGLAAVFVGIGVGLFFAGKGVNYLLDAFERLVGYLSSVVSIIVSIFSAVKDAISNLFSKDLTSTQGGDSKLNEVYGGGSSAETSRFDEITASAERSGFVMSAKDKEVYKKQAEEAAETIADYQYISYKAKYYEELNKKSTEDPVSFTPNPDTETTNKYANERDELVSQIATDDAEESYDNYKETLQNTIDNLAKTDGSSFWDPSEIYNNIQSVNTGEGLDFDLSGWEEAFNGEAESMDFSGTLNDTLLGVFGDDGELASLMSSGGISSGNELISSITGALNDGSGDITSAVGFTMDDVINAMKSKSVDVQDAAKIVPETALSTAYSYENEFYKAGVMLYTGFAEGLTDEEPKKLAVQNISDVIFNTKTALCKAAKIESPSKVFAKLGNFVTLGFAEGILQLSGAAEAATEDVAEDSTDSLRGVLNRIFDTTMSGLDTNPKITPVLDLSQLEEGLGQMNGLMSSNNTFGLAFGAANAYNTSLANRNAATDISDQYDGTNVVAAVGELRTDINDLKTIIGNLGFYVDGRQMATAIANPMSKALNDISVRTGRGVQ